MARRVGAAVYELLENRGRVPHDVAAAHLSIAPKPRVDLIECIEVGFDGGIDGIGIARVAGFLSFNVMFQCKRYQGAVTPSQIRDSRGAMQGRTDKGLVITTGTFTRDALREATRDGAPPIDLIDGEQLADRLKELRLGVRIEMIESVSVDAEWFAKM